MTPVLMLATAVLGAAAFLVNDSRRRETSSALLLPTVWILYSVAKSLSFWIDGNILNTTDEFTQGSPLDRTFLLVLVFAAVLVLAGRRAELSGFARSNPWLVALYALMAFSVLWSAYPDVSVKRWIRALGDLLMALVLLSDRDPLGALRLVLRRLAVITLPLSLVLIKYYRTLGVSYDYTGNMEMWSGVTTDKNMLGILCAVVLVFLLWELLFVPDKKRLPLNLLLAALAGYLLVGSSSSRSVTSLLCLAVGAALVLLFRLAPGNRLVAGLGLLTAAVAVAIPFLKIFSRQLPVLGDYLSLLGRDDSFTGRVFLWERLLGIAGVHPWFGVGYGGFWIGDAFDMWTQFEWGPTQGHNGYIDVYLQLGAAGAVCLVFFLLAARRTIRAADPAGGALFYALFVMILVNNCAETSFLRGANFLWSLLLVVGLRLKERAP